MRRRPSTSASARPTSTSSRSSSGRSAAGPRCRPARTTPWPPPSSSTGATAQRGFLCARARPSRPPRGKEGADHHERPGAGAAARGCAGDAAEGEHVDDRHPAVQAGFRQPQLLGVTPLSEIADGFVGEAFTVRFIPMREDVDGLDPYRSGNTLQWDAFEALQPGQVLVVDSYRTATAASGGDMLMTRAWKRGAAAVVTDGGLRDGHVLAQLPFPTYASQVTITTRAAQHHVADLQVPIGCAGVAVYPGDVLIGDRDGVLVIPRHLAAEIAEQGYEQEQLEAYVSIKIPAGEPLWGNYPPGEELKAEYKASLAAADGDPA